jgi:hypothetical protein
MDLTKSAGRSLPRFFVADAVMTATATHIALDCPMCYKARMLRDRQTPASRVVLDDRRRLPWRFFGRLTTAALTA